MMSNADLSEQTWMAWVKSKIQHVKDQWEAFGLFGILPKDGLPTPPDWWDARRHRTYAMAGYRCIECGTDKEMLDAHHLTYIRKGSEPDADLESLCRPCHIKRHPDWHTTYVCHDHTIVTQ